MATHSFQLYKRPGIYKIGKSVFGTDSSNMVAPKQKEAN